MENNNITVELNGKKYLLVEIINIRKAADELTQNCKKYNCIYQGVKEIYQSWFPFSNDYIIFKILVPEENVVAWNNEFLNDK